MSQIPSDSHIVDSLVYRIMKFAKCFTFLWWTLRILKAYLPPSGYMLSLRIGVGLFHHVKPTGGGSSP